jgi:hypothetical protein
MNAQNQSLQDLQHIKKMMERSSRFISLSGLSGISAGVCALIGAWFAYPYIYEGKDFFIKSNVAMVQLLAKSYTVFLNIWLFWIAIFTFIAAFLTSFLFTYLRSKKNGTALWGTTTFRLFWNTVIPLAAGGIFLLRMMQFGLFGFIAPGCLIFYGLALVNASKYTLGEIRFLGYGQIILGIINLWMIGYGLYFWAAGFGILHIVYGILMWLKYERKSSSNQTIISE